MLLGQTPPPPTPPAEVSPLVITGVKPGTALLSCSVRRDRSVDRCVVIKTEPLNCGFGAAALRLAEHMHLDAEAAGRAKGGKVEIPLSFSGVGGCPRPDTP